MKLELGGKILKFQTKKVESVSYQDYTNITLTFFLEELV